MENVLKTAKALNAQLKLVDRDLESGKPETFLMQLLNGCFNEINRLEYQNRCYRQLDQLNQPKVNSDKNRTDKDVHTEHCCIVHGCKYGNVNDSCSVKTGRKVQSLLCDVCTDE